MRLGAFLSTVLCACLMSVASPAQDRDQELRRRFDVLFQRLLVDPADLDANFAFAEVATQLRDYEAAIGSLERMLYYNPDLPRVRLELGLLYFRLGSYSMARTYFEGALAGPDVPADVSVRVAAFIGEIDRRLSTTQWAFFAQAGLRYQSNANAGPGSQIVRVIGTDAILDRRFVRQPDWNAFFVANLRHVYDFENQRGDVWETTLTTYLSRQFRFSRLNLGVVELQTGPRLALAPDALPGAYVRPYAIGNFAWLGDNPYLGSIGGGVGIGATFGQFQIEPFVELRRRNFHNSRDYVAAREQSGRLWSAGVVVGSAIGAPLRWQSRVAYARNDTRSLYAFYGFEQFSADLALPFEFKGPFGARSWVFAPFAGFTHTQYETPNPIVDPNVRRLDREWRVGASLEVPVHGVVGLAAQVSYSHVDSNLPNYRTRNLAVSFGPTVRF